MERLSNPVLRLRAQIVSLEDILADLRTQLARAEFCSQQDGTQVPSHAQDVVLPPEQPVSHREKTFESIVDCENLSEEEQWRWSWELTTGEHKRYGRQLIMPEIGLRGGLAL